MNAHQIGYRIYGDDMQFVEIEQDPQESVIAEAPQAGGSRREEGSILGGLGDLLDGDESHVFMKNPPACGRRRRILIFYGSICLN